MKKIFFLYLFFSICFFYALQAELELPYGFLPRVPVTLRDIVDTITPLFKELIKEDFGTKRIDIISKINDITNLSNLLRDFKTNIRNNSAYQKNERVIKIWNFYEKMALELLKKTCAHKNYFDLMREVYETIIEVIFDENSLPVIISDTLFETAKNNNLDLFQYFKNKAGKNLKTALERALDQAINKKSSTAKKQLLPLIFTLNMEAQDIKAINAFLDKHGNQLDKKTFITIITKTAEAKKEYSIKNFIVKHIKKLDKKSLTSILQKSNSFKKLLNEYKQALPIVDGKKPITTWLAKQPTKEELDNLFDWILLRDNDTLVSTIMEKLKNTLTKKEIEAWLKKARLLNAPKVIGFLYTSIKATQFFNPPHE